MERDGWTTVEEESARLRVHPETIRRWLKAGRIRGAKPGGTKAGWRIAPGEIDRVLRGETVAPAKSDEGEQR
jgi:excisionase family DNA binding protein